MALKRNDSKLDNLLLEGGTARQKDPAKTSPATVQAAATPQPQTVPQPQSAKQTVTVETAKPVVYPGTPGPSPTAGPRGTQPEKSAAEAALPDDYDKAKASLQDARDKLDETNKPRAQTEAEQRTLEDYERAMAALRQTEKAAPSYDGGLDAQIDELFGKITGRGEFSYKLNEDALWQQLKDDYTRQGKSAMRDTMGQAAMLTGGYGSSYGQAAGQAAYDEYLTRLSERAPELYDRAYARYRDEGDEMRKNLDFLLERDRTGYDRYRDAYGDWLKERDYLGGQAEDAYSKAVQERGYADERADLAYTRALQELGLAGDDEREAYKRRVQERAYTDERADAEYKKQGDRRELLLSLLPLGYTPSEQEIRDAGLTRAQVDALLGAYAPQPSVVYVQRPGASGNGEFDAEESAGERAGEYNAAAPGAVLTWQNAQLEKTGKGAGLPAQKMGSIYTVIAGAPSGEAALDVLDELPDRLLNDMNRLQKKQLIKALGLAGVDVTQVMGVEPEEEEKEKGRGR